MPTMKENIQITFPAFSNSMNEIIDYFSQFWAHENQWASFLEVGIVIGIGALAYFLQKWMVRRYLNFVIQEERAAWYQKLVFRALPFTTPLIAFVLLSLAMSLSSGFTQNLEIYKVSFKLTGVWWVWLLITRTIPDLFVRWVVTATLIPFLVFSAFNLSAPLLNYLDSLGFSLAGINVSIYLILKGLLIATCLFWFARLVSQGAVTFIESQKKITLEIRDLLENVFQVVLYTTVFLITLDLLGIDLKSLAIIGGAIGIGIGLGLQKIAANFISGLIILFEQNVKVGHLVEIQGGGSPGWIRHLGARAAVIETGDGRELLIPNEELLTKTLTDWTFKDKKVRTDLQIRVAFHSDLEKAKEIMLEAVASHPICSKMSPPDCFLEKFTENGAQFLLQFWVDDLSYKKMDMQNDVLLTIWKRFAQENIEFPAPFMTQNKEIR